MVTSGTAVVPMAEEDIAKYKRVFELFSKSVPVDNIANFYKVSVATIYEWVRKYKTAVSHQYTQTERSELLLDRIRFQEVVRDLAMIEVHNVEVEMINLKASKKSVGSKVISALLSHKRRFLETASRADHLIFDSLYKTGVLPNAVREIHCSIDDTRPISDDPSKLPEKTPESMQAAIESLLRFGRTIDINDKDEDDPEILSGFSTDPRRDKERIEAADDAVIKTIGSAGCESKVCDDGT